ncbi:MAG: hypothetical protein WKG01_31810 [Kofleriaceae bacterium]
MAVVVGLSAPAAAGEFAIVLESYTGDKPAEASQVLSPLLGELGKHNFLTGYEVVGRSFEDKVSRPALTEAGLPADFAKQIEAGYDQWSVGQFNEAVETLGKVIRAARDNPGAFTKQELREPMFKAMIAHALSTSKIGDRPAAEQMLLEIVRCYPTRDLPRGVYGQQAVTDYEAARKKLGNKLGTLTVSSDVSAPVFVNERLVGNGKAVTESLLPGEYRVFLKLDAGLSRVHKVTIKANSPTVLTIESGFEYVVRTTDKLTGFLFTSKEDRTRNEARYAQQFARSIDAIGVAVAGIDSDKKRPVVAGVLVNLMNGVEMKRAHVALGPDPSPEKLRGLAMFLIGSATSPVPEGIDVISTAPAAVPDGNGGFISQTPVDRQSRIWGGWKYVTGGAAVGALIVGGVLLSYDGKCPGGGTGCGNVYETKSPAFIAIGAGAALGAVTVYLFLRGRSDDAASTTAFVAPTRGGAVAGYGFQF